MLTAEPIAHLFRDSAGVVWVDQTQVKVREIAMDHVAYGWSADELHRQHPHLSLAQIHAALGHYYDHQDAFDREMEQSMAAAEQLAGQSANSPWRQRLRHLRSPV